MGDRPGATSVVRMLLLIVRGDTTAALIAIGTSRMPNGGSPLISTDDGTLELVGMAKLSLSRDATNRYSPDVSAVGLGEGSDSGCIITEPPDGVILGTTESTPVRSAMVGGGSDPDPSV